MFDALINIVCLVTAYSCLHLGTSIAWSCGSQCEFSVETKVKYQSLLKTLPTVTAIYSFGFFILFSSYVDGLLSKIVFSLTSATILSTLVVSMAMPQLKRRPPNTD